ncbi:hypothetical protein LZP73_18285 [Shewanella sp. AS16]|uniref:hypothetical protein n=1 Tax=Shewanella sp. AS16 TaxID=2907625 RepID=UPI001F20E256|nr:hypothetical protein [Shewanella sp. AS16]MCE9688128.1 hypothetical protein [Shewanella sp. AS16]
MNISQTMALTADTQFGHDVFQAPRVKGLDAGQGKSKHGYATLLSAGNWAMGLTLLGLLCSVLVSYSQLLSFSLGAQIAGHIALVLFATLFKISYVIRCIGLNGLGKPIH